MKKNLYNKAPAYFTVEAAMVLTLVMGIIVMLIYMMFFQYDRCLSDQDMGALALKGCSLQAETKEELLQELEDYAAKIDEGKYIAWNPERIDIALDKNKIRVEQSGSLQFPFVGIALGNVEESWKVKSIFENSQLSPVSFMRNYRKIQGGK